MNHYTDQVRFRAGGRGVGVTQIGPRGAALYRIFGTREGSVATENQ